MIWKLFSHSLIAFLLGNLWGMLSRKPAQHIIWQSDYSYKSFPGAKPATSLMLGLLFFVISLPWLTFIPFDWMARMMATVFLILGYWILVKYPLLYATAVLTDESLQIKVLRHTLISINPRSIHALVLYTDPNHYTDVIFQQGNSRRLLNTLGVRFLLPTSLLHERWGIPVIDEKVLSQIDYSWPYRFLAYSLLIINPVTAMFAYVVIFGPFTSVIGGLLMFELISMFYYFAMDQLQSKQLQQLHL